MHTYLAIFLVVATVLSGPARAGSSVDALLETYRGHHGAAEFDARAGATLWVQPFSHATPPATRSCASCHTDDPRRSGRHLRTKKSIDPLAPSANPKGMVNIAKTRKWLKRNCQWTLGRECTAQEKGDLLTFLKNQ